MLSPKACCLASQDTTTQPALKCFEMAPAHHSWQCRPARPCDNLGNLRLACPQENVQRPEKKKVAGTSDGRLPTCHLCSKLHRTCIADIGWCLTFVSAPPIGYDPRAEDLRKHCATCTPQHTGTCYRPDDITPLASLVHVDSGSSAVSGFCSSPAAYRTWLTAEICQRPGTLMLIRTPPTECRQSTIQSLKRGVAVQVLDRCHHIQCVLPSRLDRSDSATTLSDSISVALM